VIVVLLAAASATRSAAQATPPAQGHSPAYDSAKHKIEFLDRNAERQPPAQVTTTLTTAEINAYLAEGGVALPAGVERVSFSSVPAVVTANARVNFDKVTAGHQMNFFMAKFFTGVHEVVTVAQATGSNGMGSVRVQTVSIDGVNVPTQFLQFLVDCCVKPKYGPNVGLNSTFRLPARINAAVVGSNQVSLTQR
jgi:hypothetical protein